VVDPEPPLQPAQPAVLRAVAPRAPQTLAVSAEGAIINYLYGQVLARPKIFAVGTIGTDLVLGLMWGKGECGSIVDVYANQDALSGAKVHNYTGTQSQTADSWLVSAIGSYSDALLGICYSVVRVSQETYPSIPAFTAIVQGKKLYDPRDLSTTYSTNPALMFRDLALLGGMAVDDPSIESTADECDALVSGEKRREAGIVFDTPNSLDDMLNTLAEYAGGFYVRDGGVAKLIENRPASVVESFTDDETDGTKIKMLKDSISIKKISVNNQPNRVIVEYTDTSSVPWRRAFATTPLPAGDVRTTRLILPGIQTYARARRQGIERLNHYTLTDLEVTFTAFDDSLALQRGDVFDVDHDDGLVAKAFRATAVVRGGQIGQWRISGREYDPAEYSNEALADPTFPDTTLPDPSAVPDAPVPSLVESNYQLQNETYATRIEASWAAVTDYPYRHEFEVQAYIGASLIWTVRTTDLEATLGPLQENETYTIDLYVIGVAGIKGNKGSANLLAQGKQLAPDFPGGAQLRGNEAGGRVFLNWDAATDDIWKYEIRFGSVAQTWANMTTLTQTDALWYTAEVIPEGTWDVKIRAIDSVGVESSNEITLSSLVVTSDADSYAQVDSTVAVDDPAGITNMSLQGADWMPDDGTSWASLFPNAMNTYTNALITYGGSFTTEIISEEHDVGAIVSANFQFAANVNEVVGVVDYVMQISDTSGGPWTDYSVLSVNASGRYARLKVTGLTTDRFMLSPEYFHLTALVNTINKEGDDTSNAGSAKVITLDAEYSKVVTIQITPIGTGGGEDLSGAVEDIVLGPGNTTFEVYIFDGGTQVARDFYWTARVIR
jgi:hypothetical protein